MLWILVLICRCPLMPARQAYQQKIPNGANVVDADGLAWPGVGHLRPGGGGDRNQFGIDFAAAGFMWTLDLCNMDSDGDGRTNGEELGDPQCLWEEGATPQFTTAITHPGFSNPGTVQVDTCQNHQLPANSVSINLTFTDYPVMTQDTTYIKQAFTFPEEASIIRIDIINDQPMVVHHMILYACNQDVSNIFGTPAEGGMPCSDVVFAWAVGGKDYCFPNDLAMIIESSGRYMALEIHYDNPNGITGILDSSGFQVHYLPGTSLTPVNYMWVGPRLPLISIPPGQESYEIKSTCDLSQLAPAGSTYSVSFFASILHGHTLARKIWVTIADKDSPNDVADISCNANYDFDLQEVVPFSNPITVTTRDILTVHCVYDSSDRTTVTQGGDETSNEMCLGLFMYYPAISSFGTIKCLQDLEVVQGDGSKTCNNWFNSTDNSPDNSNSNRKTPMLLLSISLVMLFIFN